MGIRHSVAVALVVASTGLGWVIACGGTSSSAPGCATGDTRACVGPGACAGGQVCSAGNWSACDCGGNEDAGDLDGGVEVHDAGPDGPDITPYLEKCPQVPNTPPMVRIDAPDGGSFCIEIRPATADETDKYRFNSSHWPSIPECQNASKCKDVERTVGKQAANCMSWCSATNVCAIEGKRLCTQEEVAGACFDKGSDFPWGDPLDAMVDKCGFNGVGDASVYSKDLGGCHSLSAPHSLVYGLVGWPLFPAGTVGNGTPPLFPPNLPNPVCGRLVKTTAAVESTGYGLRCCADVLP